MRLRISAPLAFLAFVVIAVSCSKEKYTSEPQLEFKKAENYVVPRGGLLEFTLEFTDKEGDIDDSIYVQSVVPRCVASNRTLGFRVPSFPTGNNAKGEIKVVFVNGIFADGYVPYNGNRCARPDTTTFRFWIKDRAGNVSDTVQTDQPIVVLN